MGKSVIIIGGGLSGLSTGCYAQMNGYQTRIFEMHDKSGGLCTAWQRKGFTVDGCLTWLTSSAPGTGLYKLWEELGMIHGQQMYYPEIFFNYETADGHVFNFYTDLSKLEKHMLEIAPEDKAAIKRLIKAIKSFTHMDMPVDKAPELCNAADGFRLMLKILPVLGDFSRYSRMTVQELARTFTNPLLRRVWESAWLPEFTSLFIMMSLALMYKRQSGYVIGGSMRLSQSLEKRYKDLGGKIDYRAKVDKILVEYDHAAGIRLEDGSEYHADYIVSAADGHATIFDLLEGKYVDDKILGYYREMPIFQPVIYIGLGVNRILKDVPESLAGRILELEQPISIAGSEQKSLHLHIYSYDPTLAPQGKTMVTIMIESNYDYWEKLYSDRQRYLEEKNKIAEIVIEQIDRHFPCFKSQVEMIDVATPVTFKRYTGNWQGSFEGWQMTPKIVTLNMSKTLPGLDNFFMAGQWVMPGGGIPSGALTGRWVTQIMCKKDGLKFRTIKP